MGVYNHTAAGGGGGGGGGRRRRARKPYGAVLQCPRVALDYSLGGLLRLPLDSLDTAGGSGSGSGAEPWKSVQQTVQSHPFASVGVTAQLGSFTRPLLDFSRVRFSSSRVSLSATLSLNPRAIELGELETQERPILFLHELFPPTCYGGGGQGKCAAVKSYTRTYSHWSRPTEEMCVCVCVCACVGNRRTTAVTAAARGGQLRGFAVAGSARVGVDSAVDLLLGGASGGRRKWGAVRGDCSRQPGAWAAGARAAHALRSFCQQLIGPLRAQVTTNPCPLSTPFLLLDSRARGRAVYILQPYSPTRSLILPPQRGRNQ